MDPAICKDRFTSWQSTQLQSCSLPWAAICQPLALALAHLSWPNCFLLCLCQAGHKLHSYGPRRIPAKAPHDWVASPRYGAILLILVIPRAPGPGEHLWSLPLSVKVTLTLMMPSWLDQLANYKAARSTHDYPTAGQLVVNGRLWFLKWSFPLALLECSPSGHHGLSCPDSVMRLLGGGLSEVYSQWEDWTEEDTEKKKYRFWGYMQWVPLVASLCQNQMWWLSQAGKWMVLMWSSLGTHHLHLHIKRSCHLVHLQEDITVR